MSVPLRHATPLKQGSLLNSDVHGKWNWVDSINYKKVSKASADSRRQDEIPSVNGMWQVHIPEKHVRWDILLWSLENTICHPWFAI